LFYKQNHDKNLSTNTKYAQMADEMESKRKGLDKA